MKNLVLLVSAGRTDLKLLAGESGAFRHAEVGRDSTRAFHDWLVQYPRRFIVDTGNTAEGSVQLEIQVQDDGSLQAIGRPEKPGVTAAPLPLHKDAQDRYVVVPVKLGRIMDVLKDRVKAGEIAVRAAVVFNTRRNQRSRFAKEEPFACGPVLAGWLAGRFGLKACSSQQPGFGKSVWVDLLRDDEDQEDRNQSVNPKAVNRLVDILTAFPGDASTHAALCGIGGIPRFKNLIRDSAFFYFNGRCELAEDPEGRADVPVIHGLERLHVTAEQSFALRAHVGHLIGSGDFLGAEAAIRHVEDDQYLPWTLPVRCVADLLRGLEVNGDIMAELVNISSKLGEQITSIQASGIRCLLPALRAEAALQGNRLVEAINSTSAFIDAAVRDGIEKCLKNYGEIDELDEFDRRVKFTGTAKIPSILLKPIKGKGNKISAPLTLLNAGNTYKLDAMGNCEKVWLKDAIKCQPLTKLNNLINKPDFKNQRTPYNYRNINTHGVLQSHDLQAAEAAFVKAGLWRQHHGAAGGHNGNKLFFLIKNSDAAGTLSHFGIPDADQIYLDLVRLLRENLRSFRF